MAATGETQIDDGRFRVTRWTIDPGDEIPMHLHQHDYVVVPLVDYTMHATNADGSETVTDMRNGESYGRVAGAEHAVANRGSERIMFIEVERLS